MEAQDNPEPRTPRCTSAFDTCDPIVRKKPKHFDSLRLYALASKVFRFSGGDGGIWTPARLATPIGFRIRTLQPLGYISIYNVSRPEAVKLVLHLHNDRYTQMYLRYHQTPKQRFKAISRRYPFECSGILQAHYTRLFENCNPNLQAPGSSCGNCIFAYR